MREDAHERVPAFLQEMRVYLLIQLTSQVLPPSSEKASSDWALSGEMLQMEKRTRTERSLMVS